MHLALAIADEPSLKSLLTQCMPAIAAPHNIGHVTSQASVPAKADQVLDGLLQFESIQCVLASQVRDRVVPDVEGSDDGIASEQNILQLTRWQSPIQTLGCDIGLSRAIALLENAGFLPAQVQQVLHLPQEAWYKSWWYTLDELGHQAVPFRRFIRTRHYADGTYTIQYRDFFAQEMPPCFNSRPKQALVVLHHPAAGFHQTLGQINGFRQHFGLEQVILVGESLSDLEAEGFIRQGVSLYTATDLFIPVQANCQRCVTHTCPMNGRQDSPVRTCDRFCLDAEPD